MPLIIHNSGIDRFPLTYARDTLSQPRSLILKKGSATARVSQPALHLASKQQWERERERERQRETERARQTDRVSGWLKGSGMQTARQRKAAAERSTARALFVPLVSLPFFLTI